MAFMTDEELRANVLELMTTALDWFHGELERFGTKQSPAPALLVTVKPNITGIIPLDSLKTTNQAAMLTCHLVLKELNALSYVFVCDVRTDEARPKYGVHCCGGAAGWDAAVAETYRFKGGKVEVVQKSEVRDSTMVRKAHYTVIPNLFDAIPDSDFTPDELGALRYVAGLYAETFRQNLPKLH